MTIFTRERTEQMGTGIAVFGYGCALGSMVAGLFVPFIASWFSSDPMTWYGYLIVTVSILQACLLGGFVWGSLCGALFGGFVNPHWFFNDHPKVARLISALCVTVPVYFIASIGLATLPSLIIAFTFLFSIWLVVGMVSLYFIDRELRPLSKYDILLQEINNM